MTDVLDQAQLVRIEATHRGFLYQHLYAAGCLLLAPTSGATEVLVERDEDIELLFPDRHVYIQVKSRKNPLRMGDIRSAIKRMAEIRIVHKRGGRIGTPQFWIVTDSIPGPDLLSRINDPNWLADIKLIWPEQPPDVAFGLPPGWPSLPDALNWCNVVASTIPYSRIPAGTLTWKLAAFIHFACTGTAPYEQHSISTADLPDLFEQILIQLQDFPEPPPLYRPHEAELEYVLENNPHVRLIVGLSGAGKTAWASQLALHVGSSVAYYAIALGAGVSLASGIARELAARYFKNDRDGFAQALLPGITGIESLRAIDLVLIERHLQVTVVLDNIHYATPSEVRDLVSVTSAIRYILLAQPWPAQRELEALLGIEGETFSGWSIDTIAAAFSSSGARIDPQTSLRVQRLTGGLPLYVQSTVRLTVTRYDGNSEQFCADLEAQTHIERTAQEIILSRVFQGLPIPAQSGLALLSIADVFLTRSEASQILSHSLRIDDRRIAHILRSLVDFGIVQQTRDQRIVVHDAFRVVAVDYQLSMDERIVQETRAYLKDLLKDSLVIEYDPPRMSQYLRLLVATGDTETLVDIAGFEYLHERGHFGDIRAGLESVINTADFSAQSKFWALDSLAFNDFQSGHLDRMEQRLTDMERLLPDTEDGIRERLSLLMKRMIVDSKKKRYVPITQYTGMIQDYIRENPELTRIFRYNYALSLYLAGFFGKAQKEAFDLVMEYYDVLGLHFSQIFAKNVPDIAPLLEERKVHLEDVKRTGDALKLLASCLIGQGKKPSLAHIHAVKFYDLAHAFSSLVKVGQDVADEYLGILHDPDLARSFIENSLLPVIEGFQLMQYVVPVRAQYAVVLAYCGEGAASLGEIERLTAFYGGLPPENRAEFDNQRALIIEILEGRKKLTSPGGQGIVAPVDKNASCPCGSGRRYRNCHGRGRTVPNVIATASSPRIAAQTDTDDFERVFNRYVESIGGRDGLQQQNLNLIANNGQPCDVITRLRKRYIDVRIHHRLIASFMYGVRGEIDLPDRITLVKDGKIVAEIRPRDIWVVHPMPENGFTEEELNSVDISEGDVRAPNGLTVRQMIRDTYGCKTSEECDYFLRRFLGS